MKKKFEGASRRELEKRIMDLDSFDIPDGVYARPRFPDESKVKVRALANSCKEKGIESKDLNPKEMKRFLVY